MSDQTTHGRADERVVRVFLSSTFRDMQAEREELVKRVFPRIARICRQRHVDFCEVDLRWGITDQEKQEGKVLSICFDEIDRCRPFFVAMLGSRYGWVPDVFPAELTRRYPSLASDPGRSATELEITYGVLDNPTMMGRSFFLLRHSDAGPAGPESETARLEALKQRIRRSGMPVLDGYRSVQEAGERVYQFLAEAIDQQFPEADTPDAFAREDAAQAALVRRHTRFFSPEGRMEHHLDVLVSGAATPVLLAGGPGVGKTALLANWLARRQSPPPAAKPSFFRRLAGGANASPDLVSLFVGASAASTNWRFIVRYLAHTLVRRFQLAVRIPEHGKELIDAFADCLARAAAVRPIILVIDGLDHLWAGDGAHSLFWLPAKFARNVHVILSSGPGQVVAEAEKRGWQEIAAPTLRAEQRQAIVESRLAVYRKKLDDTALAQVAAAEGGRFPAFLGVLLNEIRVHGEHETLAPMLTHYLEARDTHDLLDRVLQRWERDYDGDRPGFVGAALSLLWASAGGLTEAELVDLLGADGAPFPRVLLSTLLHAAGDLLSEGGGRLTITQSDLRDAVARRYLPDDDAKAQSRLQLARYFGQRDYGLHRPERSDGHSWRDDVRELADLYAAAGAWQELAALLTDSSFLTVACLASRDAVARHWAAIEAKSPIRMVDAYRQAIDAPNDFGPARELALLLAGGGHRPAAVGVLNRLIERYRLPPERFAAGGKATTFLFDPKFLLVHGPEHAPDSPRQQTLQVLLLDRAVLLRELRELDAAGVDLAEAERIAEHWRDLAGVARCKMRQGEVAASRGDHTRAVRLFQDAGTAARSADDADAVADAASLTGQALFELGRVDEARRSQEDAIAFCLERGHARGLGILHNNLGIIYRHGNLAAEALRMYEECERWYRRMEGSVPTTSLGQALGTQAELLEQLGRPAEAVPRYREAAGLFAAAGNRVLEQSALSRLMRHLGEAINNPSLSLARDDQVLEEAESTMLRLFELVSTNAATPVETLTGLAQNTVALLMRRAMRLRELGRPDEAQQRFTHVVALARAHGLADAERLARAMGKVLPDHAPDSRSKLACVHCGRTDDPLLGEREHQFVARNRGRQYFFAQCVECRTRFLQANAGPLALKTIIGGYPEAQLRRALAPGSDELWIA
jgi:tetratricopeptide (TPR) repeat protein